MAKNIWICILILEDNSQRAKLTQWKTTKQCICVIPLKILKEVPVKMLYSVKS